MEPLEERTFLAPVPKEQCNLDILVRRARPDVGAFSDPTCANEAPGAEFAWANNRETLREVWSARAFIAVPRRLDEHFDIDLPLIETLAVSPFFGLDRTSNARDIEGVIDNLTYGATFEVGFEDLFGLGATQYIDVDGGVVSGFSGPAKNWGVNVTWKPIGDEIKNAPILSYLGDRRWLNNFVTANLSPTIQTTFSRSLSETDLQPIFADDDWALRTGPAATLRLEGVGTPGATNLLTDLWGRLSYQVSYGWLYDWVSGRDYGLLDTSIELALDNTGNLGLTLSYRKGALEETGQDVDLTNLGLSVAY